MTDIRRHGFESDAQWREHLEEIEEMPISTSPVDVPDPGVFQELADLRRQVDAMRVSLRERPAHRGQAPRWQAVGAGMLFLLLLVARRHA
jgi:hypothetical protein